MKYHDTEPHLTFVATDLAFCPVSGVSEMSGSGQRLQRASQRHLADQRTEDLVPSSGQSYT